MPVPIGPGSIVSLKLAMYDAQGVLLDAPERPLTYLHGGYGGLLDALENALEGKLPGDEVRLQLEPEEAFGEYDAELLRVEPAERYGEGLALGMEIEEEGNIYRVTDIAGGKVVLDANHPLAGIALRFCLKVENVRAANPEEMPQGVSLPQA